MQPAPGFYTVIVVDENGLSDITYQGFLSPANPGALIWGAGATLQLPTASNDLLGQGKYQAGPAAMLFYLLVYTLMNIGAFGIVISVAHQGEDRLQVRQSGRAH